MNITLNKLAERAQNCLDRFNQAKPRNKWECGCMEGYQMAIQDIFEAIRAIEREDLAYEAEKKENTRLASIEFARMILRANNEML